MKEKELSQGTATIALQSQSRENIWGWEQGSGGWQCKAVDSFANFSLTLLFVKEVGNISDLK